MTVE
jgi:hypothetical protein